MESGKLCILVNSLAGGGAEKVALTLFEEYQRQGVDVCFLCVEKNDVHSIEASHVFYLSDKTGGSESGIRKLFSLVHFALRLKRFVKDQGIDFVQSHMYRANYISILARKLGSGHRVQIANHGIASRYLDQGLEGRTNLFLIRWLYPAADQLVCPSAGMLEDLRRLGVSVSCARVIGNPFDIQGILARGKEPLGSDAFSFDSGKQYLISVGRLEEVKHPALIIHALYQLVEKRPELELLLLGRGNEEENLRALCARLGIQSKVHFLGQMENPFNFLRHADLLVSASEYEGFSNVIVEAMIVGTPVISTDCPSGPREILAPGSVSKKYLGAGEFEEAEFGVLVPTGDVDVMTDAIEKLLLSDEKPPGYAEKGVLRADDFDQSSIADRYLEGAGRTAGQ